MDENRYPFPLLPSPLPLLSLPCDSCHCVSPDMAFSPQAWAHRGCPGGPGAARPISQGRLIMFGWAQCWEHSFPGVSWHSPPFPEPAESPRLLHVSLLSLQPFLHPDHPLISFTPSLRPLWSLLSGTWRTEQKSLPAHLGACCILRGQKARMF